MSEDHIKNLLSNQIVDSENGNFVKSIEDLQSQTQDIYKRPVVLDTLDELTDDLGVVRSGEFRAGNGIEPGEGFSGVRMAYPPLEYPAGSGIYYNIVGIENDVLEFGLNATDGSAVFAGGDGVIDEEGIDLNGIRYALKHYATDIDGNNPRFGRFEMLYEDGKTIPSLAITFMDGVSPSNVIANGSFDTGDLTNWTPDTAGYWSVETIWDGNACEFINDVDVDDYMYSDRAAVTENTPYIFERYASGYRYWSGGWRYSYFTFSLLWYDNIVGGTLLRTDVYTGSGYFGGGQLFSNNITSPAGAQSVEVAILGHIRTAGATTITLACDKISLYGVNFVRKILFGPEPEIESDTKTTRIVGTVKELPVPLTPTISLVATAVGNCTNGAHRVKLVFTDMYGKTLACGVSNSVTVDAAHKKITVPLPIGIWGTTQRLVYMNEVGLTTYKLAATVPNNTDTTVDINIADANLGEIEPVYNTSGNRPQFPRSGIVFGHNMTVINASGTSLTVVTTNTASQIRYQHYSYAGVHSDGDRYQASMLLDEGEYELSFYGVQAGNGCLMDVYVDGVLISSANDLYSGVLVNDHEIFFTNVDIVGSGYHLIELVANGKNGSSGGYRCYPTYVSAVWRYSRL